MNDFRLQTTSACWILFTIHVTDLTLRINSSISIRTEEHTLGIITQTSHQKQGRPTVYLFHRICKYLRNLVHWYVCWKQQRTGSSILPNTM